MLFRSARWDEHQACLRVALEAGREVYMKMPVDETTAPGEVERGARLVAAADPRVPLFLTPLTEPASPRQEDPWPKTSANNR